MKILHIVPSYKPADVYGGPIESIGRLCEGLAMAGNEVHVFTTTANGKAELDVIPGKAVDVDGVKVTYFERITKDPTHISPKLWKHLYNAVANYDVVHIHSWWNILVIVASKICLLKGAKVIIAPRGMLSAYIFNSGSSKIKKAMHALFGKGLLQRSYLHATAEAEYNECQEIIPGWKGFVLPNIIALPDSAVTKRANEVFTMIFLSRIHPKKGIELLLKAVSILDFDIILRIAGDGEESYVAQLKQLAEELNLSNKIEWLGWLDRDQKFEALAKADLFTLVSMNENFANVVVESLHMGTPVLISKDVALSSFVKDKEMGWVTTLDVMDVASKITEAKNDQQKRKLIAQHGRDVIKASFSAETLIGQYLREYRLIQRN